MSETTTATPTIKIGDLIYNKGHWLIGEAAGVVRAFYPSEDKPQVAIYELIHEPGSFAGATHFDHLTEGDIGEAFGQDEGIDADRFYAGLDEHLAKGTLTAEQCDRLHELYLAAHSQEANP